MQSPSRLQMAGAGDSQGPDSDTEKWQGNISYKMHQFRAQHEINQQPSPVTTCTQVDWTQARNEPAWSFLEREGLHFLTFFSRQNLQVWSTQYTVQNYFTIFYCLRVTLHNWCADVWCLQSPVYASWHPAPGPDKSPPVTDSRSLTSLSDQSAKFEDNF